MNIEIREIQKKFQDTQVLNIENNIGFESHRIHGLIGPNGAGKTTLLRIIAGVDKDYEGELLYDNKKNHKDIYKEMTYVRQSPYMIKASVKDNILYPLKIRNIVREESESKVECLIKEFRLDELKDKNAKKLSGGEMQRVALARALSFDPKLIILDEPASNLDPEYIELIEKSLLKRVKNKDLTVIIVTHNISQAKRICDKLYVMHKGKITEYGDTDIVIKSPKREDTRKFLSFA